MHTMVKFEDYEEHAFSTAYFIDIADDTEQKRIVRHGFTEEVNELLTDESSNATMQLLWGKLEEGEEKTSLQEEKLSEVGDVLYFMTAAGFYTPYTLQDIAKRGLELFRTPQTAVDSFEEFDAQLEGLIELTIGERYNPDYLGMQLFDFPPFLDSKGLLSSDIEFAEGKLLLHGDGLYAIERLSRDFESSMFYNSRQKGYIDSAGLLLAGLSLIAQHRLGGSLAKSAQINIDKRNRRVATATIERGVDSERSRPTDVARPSIQGFESTEYNLLYGVRA